MVDSHSRLQDEPVERWQAMETMHGWEPPRSLIFTSSPRDHLYTSMHNILVYDGQHVDIVHPDPPGKSSFMLKGPRRLRASPGRAR